MEFRTAGIVDFQKMVLFYYHVSADTPDMESTGRWKYGVYPSDSCLRRCIGKGDLCYYMENNKVAAAMALSLSQGEEYHGISWGADLEDNQVATVQLMAVDPDRQREGLGTKAVESSIRMARLMGRKALRLNCLSTNVPAQRLYESMGFQRCGQKKLETPDKGEADFCFYEYLL